jgi:hypothetical protein
MLPGIPWVWREVADMLHVHPPPIVVQVWTQYQRDSALFTLW